MTDDENDILHHSHLIVEIEPRKVADALVRVHPRHLGRVPRSAVSGSAITRRALLCAASAAGVLTASGRTRYVDTAGGSDSNDGLSPVGAWRTIEKAGSVPYSSGDRLLFKRGSVFCGGLNLNAHGREGDIVLVDSYGEGPAPIIDARGGQFGIRLHNCSGVEIANLEITADSAGAKESHVGHERHGVWIVADKGESSQIHLRGLHIHDIFPAGDPAERLGSGITAAVAGSATLSGIRIEGCRIERTARFGIHFAGRRMNNRAISDIQLTGNRLKNIGGPGIQPSSVTGLIVRGNTVDSSGSSADRRMWGRGSGIWPWNSQDVLIEKNAFLHARGAGDSCGMHIDFDCRDVMIQYNLSIDNEGGFIEILGNNINCCYRYNISVNDGSRVAGRNGARHDGKILWLSSYRDVYSNRGPANTYIYNNTIYVRPDLPCAFSITPMSDGLLIANNIFYLPGPTRLADDSKTDGTDLRAYNAQRLIIRNNLYLRHDTLPDDLLSFRGKPVRDANPIVADPRFSKPGGIDAVDYIPSNSDVVRNRGMIIQAIPGDSIGLRRGLAVREDFLGNSVTSPPDLGAIQAK